MNNFSYSHLKDCVVFAADTKLHTCLTTAHQYKSGGMQRAGVWLCFTVECFDRKCTAFKGKKLCFRMPVLRWNAATAGDVWNWTKQTKRGTVPRFILSSFHVIVCSVQKFTLARFRASPMWGNFIRSTDSKKKQEKKKKKTQQLKTPCVHGCYKHLLHEKKIFLFSPFLHSKMCYILLIKNMFCSPLNLF